MDVQTVYLLFVILNFAIIGVSIFLWIQNRDYFEGLFWWIIALGIQQLGMTFLIGYSFLPKILSVGLSNCFFMISIPMFIYVLGKVSSVAFPNRINAVIGMVSSAAIIYFVVIIDSLYGRVLTFSLATLFFSGEAIIQFVREKMKNKQCQSGIIVWAFAILLGVFAARIVYYMIVRPDESLYYFITIEEIVAIGTLLTNILLILGLSIIINGVYIKRVELQTAEVEGILKKTEELARTDELTGIANRRYFNNVLYGEIKRSNRYGGSLALILVDIDLFKKINDSYGHDIGDKTLVKLSKCLSENIRNSDTIARWGGEEFAIILVETTRQDAIQTAEKLRIAVEQLQFDEGFTITASFGVAERLQGESYSSWFKKADNAIFMAKSNGRNRVEFSDMVYGIEEKLASIHWGEDYQSGFESIDREHRELLEKLSAIYQSEHNYIKMLQLVKELLVMTEQHFINEEKIMENEKFPYFENHKIAHDELLSNANALVGSIHAVSDISSKSVAYVLQELIIEHMLKQDGEFVKFIKG